VRQIRKTAVNRNRETGFKSSIGSKNGDYILETVGDGFSLKEGVNKLIEATEEPYVDYCRRINFEGDSNSSKKVFSIVTWGGSDCLSNDEKIMYSTFLADLKQ